MWQGASASQCSTQTLLAGDPGGGGSFSLPGEDVQVLAHLLGQGTEHLNFLAYVTVQTSTSMWWVGPGTHTQGHRSDSEVICVFGGRKEIATIVTV